MSKNILLKDVTFQHDKMTEPIFDGMNISINEEWKLGLLGKNGSGKTTLLDLLLGNLDYRGIIETPLEFTYFPNYPENAGSEFTIDLLLSRNPTVEQWEIEKELHALELSYDLLYQPFATLSGGEQAKMMLLELFLDEHKFPLIDEPTNNLDLHGRNLVAQYLNKQKGYIVVSHDEAFLNQFVDHVLSINKQTIELIAGDVETWRTELTNANNLALERNGQLKKEITRLKDTSKRMADWGSQKENASKDASSRRLAAKQMKKSKAVQKRRDNKIDEKSQLIDNVQNIRELEMHVLVPKKRLITMKDFSILRNGEPLFQPISFELLPGDRLFIKGNNGVGKSTLLDFILNPSDMATVGTYKIQLPPKVSILEQRLLRKEDYFGFFDALDGTQQEVLWRILSELGLSKSKFNDSSSKEWSEGELKKINIAKSLLIPSEVYVWDEGTNYLDIDIVSQLIDAIQLNEPTMLAVDHNEKFVEEAATKVLILEK
ncbi:ATP-binding cassette domain-containing protein [Desemzia sp. FAM 23991]|uniref:ATP-binding cassette domain-containing protein n=2 Tax=Desemzia TaxID=82800 RepID=UPI0038863EBD